MKKQPIWFDSRPVPDSGPLRGRVTVDVLVVGGGITGLTTACLLHEAGCRVAVVDRQDIARGETAHTTAHLTCVTDSRLQDLAGRFGKTTAQAAWDAGVCAIRQMEKLAQELAPDCELRRVPGYLMAAQDQDRAMLEREVALARELGFSAEFQEAAPVFRRPAVCFPDQGKFHPLKYLRGLAASLIGRGVRVFSHTDGSGVDRENHELKTREGTIVYDVLVAATHVPIRGERGVWQAAAFQTKLAGYSTYALEARVEGAVESLFWDTADPYTYHRFDLREGEGSVIIGGEDHKTGQARDTEACYARLEHTLRQQWPSAELRHRWSGQVWETPDGLPYIGQVADRQYLATGFAGNGMTWGTFSAMVLRDLIAGRSNPWEKIFAPGRTCLSATGTYLRENRDFPLGFLASRMKPRPEAPVETRGEGNVVETKAGKRAVYRDESGRQIVLSPVCPHMGCLVGWNSAEQTWDCPCHGSRFAATGEVLSGPAESPLEILPDQDGEEEDGREGTPGKSEGKTERMPGWHQGIP